ncbi:MAG: putative metallopeptidase [Candidatus Nanoarchaeia archaeon]|jgi:predicted metallopeptidase
MIKYESSLDIKNRVNFIINSLGLDYIDADRVICFKSTGSRSQRVRARCYGFYRILQQALNIKPHYIIEVIGEYYDSSSNEYQDKLLIHELLHIPKTFSGALKNHHGSAHKELVAPSIVNYYYDCLINNKPIINSNKAKGRVSVNYKPVPEVKARLNQIINKLGLAHINPEQIICFESAGSKTNSPILIGPLPIIWQKALGLKPHYIIEVISEKYYNLRPEERDKALIKVLSYVPKSFSGSLNRHKVSLVEVNKSYNELISQEGFSWI